MDRLYLFLNPMRRLGMGKYSVFAPLLGNLSVLSFVELFLFLTDSQSTFGATLIITSSILLVVYFAFRDGIRGGIISVGLILFYYLYIIFSRQELSQRQASIQTTFFLTGVYISLSAIIGWLKQYVDRLIIKEKKATIFMEEEKIRLNRILEHLPIAIRIANLRDNRIEGNKKLEELLRRKVNGNLESEIAYLTDHEYKNGKKMSSEDLTLVKALKEKKKSISEEIEYIRDDKKKLKLKINSAPIFNKKRKLISVVSVLSDVTVDRLMEERKNNFINMASHELKTPITSMKLLLNLLLKRSKEQNNTAIFELVSNLILQTERLQQLASDLLDVSRIQTGKLFFMKQEFLLNELIAEVCDLFRETRQDKRIVVKDTNTLVVSADRFRIYQVLTNLMTNAIKYSDKDGEIIIQAKKAEGFAHVSVKDFGIGIDNSQQKKIFGLLYQVKDGRDKTFPGLGMGLFISKEIVKRHKGKIWVESEKGRGSTFHFTIPLDN